MASPGVGEYLPFSTTYDPAPPALHCWGLYVRIALIGVCGACCWNGALNPFPAAEMGVWYCGLLERPGIVVVRGLRICRRRWEAASMIAFITAGQKLSPGYCLSSPKQ
jgi:hypothetical protein